MTKFLIAHDLGTSGDKATLFTTDGELVKSITYVYDTHFFNSTGQNRIQMTGGKQFVKIMRNC